jgi:predicted branched-subunit amino acid permease
MTRAGTFLTAVWEFVVGDDWRTAVGVVVALLVTALIAELGGSAWWVMPPAVLGLLALSIRRAVRSASRGG